MAPPIYDDYYYRNRRAIRSAKRAKAKRLLIDLFGEGNYSSVFTAFDPFYPFKFAKEDISPVNRKRKILMTRAYSRTRTKKRRSVYCSTPLVVVGPGVTRYDPLTCTGDETVTNGSLPNQPNIFGFLNDTAKNTRPDGVNQGELEMFLPKITAGGRSVNWVNSEAMTCGTTLSGNYHSFSQATHLSSITSSARITQVNVDTYLTAEKANFAAKAEEKATLMLGQLLPTSRKFDALREIGELRDLPRTLFNTLSGIAQIAGGRGVNVSSAYLNKEFGWDPFFNSLLELVELPGKIAKRVNYLITRSSGYQGMLPTTLRSRHSYVESVPVAGTFAFDVVHDEISDSVSHSAARLAEWRIAVNCLIKFPPMELPLLKEDLKSRMYGLKFRPQDLWNLLPWTWFFDWFAGVSQYIDTVCAVNEDVSIINWGFLTYRSTGWLIGNQSGHVSSSYTSRQNADPIVSYSIQRQTSASAELKYIYQRRVDLSTVSDVRRSWKLEQFSGFQLSILSALFFQNENFKGFGSRKVRK